MDAGTYTCSATNKFGSVSATGSLIVRRRTLIKTPPLDVMVFAGTEAKFTCTATTDPEEVENLKIVWKKDDQIIDYRYVNVVLVHSAFRKIIKNVICSTDIIHTIVNYVFPVVNAIE